MAFTLEALEAKHGDALLLHWGDDRLIVIDGGPSGVFTQTLKPRLEAIRAERGVDTLPIRLLMVSHIDDDHIHGVLDLTRFLADLDKEKKRTPWKIATLWHNAFDDIVGTVEPFSTALGKGTRKATFEDGLTFTIVGPLEAQVEALRKDWDKKLAALKKKKKTTAEAQAIAAAFVDKSVYNLSSIAVLATRRKRTMLLTGDARGDFLLEGLRAAKLMKKDTLHVDLLKVPHHGSDRNVEEDFFRKITADHYVISADGRHGNPDPKMLGMLTRARGAAEYTIHLTNRVPAAERFFEKDRAKGGRKYDVINRANDAPSVTVAL